MDYAFYVILSPVMLVLLIFSLMRAWRFRADPQARVLILNIIITLGWLTVNFFELVFEDPTSKIILAKSNYLFNGAFCSVWLFFALRFAGYKRLLNRWMMALALLPVVAGIVMAATNEFTSLIWKEYAIIDVGHGLNAMRVTQYGAGFWPLLLAEWSMVLAGFALILARFWRASPLYRRQAAWVLMGASLPVVFNVVYVLRLFPWLQKDYTPLSFGLATVFITFGILRVHLFELAPVARYTLVDQIALGMVALNHDMRVVDSNPAAAQLLDRPLKMTGTPLQELFPGQPEIAARLPRQINLPVEMDYRTPAGRWLSVRIWGLSGSSSQSSGWVMILEDVTATRHTLEELRRSEDLFQNLVNSMRAGVAVTDLQGRITYASPRMLEMFGLRSQADAEGKTIFDFLVEEEFKRGASSFQELVSGIAMPDAPYQHRRTDGTTFFTNTQGALLRNPDGSPYGCVFMVRDITQRLAAEREQARLLQIMQTVVEDENIFLSVSDANGKIVLWNRGAEIVTGVSAADALAAEDIIQLTHPNPEQYHKVDQLRRRLHSGQSINSSGSMYSRNGTLKYTDLFSRALMDNNGQPLGVVNVGLDITTRVQAEHALQTLNSGLEELVSQRTGELRETVTRLEEENAARQKAEDELRRAQETLVARLNNQSRQLAALYEVILTSGKALEWEYLLDYLLEKVLEITGGQAAAIYQRSLRDSQMLMVAQRGLPAIPAPEFQVIPIPFDPHAPAPTLPGLESALSEPIHLHEEITGAMRIWRDARRAYTLEDMALTHALADQVGIIMENMRLRGLIEQAAVEQERRRMARNLHDSVTQSLHSLVWLTEVAANRLKQGQIPRLDQSLQQIDESARQALKEMRLLLYQTALESSDLPLYEALKQRLEAVEERAGLQANLDIDPACQVPVEWESDLYAVAVEALNNTLKYARASWVSVRLRCGADWCEMEISDNGRGFDLQSPRAGGLGLQSMRERATKIGGEVTIQSIPGKGTQVQLLIGTPRRKSRSISRQERKLS